MNDLHEIGGVPVVLRRLLEADLLHGDAMTVTGRTLAEELAELEDRGALPDDDEIEADFLYTVDDPKQAEGAIKILDGNLAPEGAVLKVTGDDAFYHEGPARIFENEEDAMEYVQSGAIDSGDVIVIRNEGRPAARECARCSASPPPSSARATRRTWRCSRTAASRAGPAAR